MAFQIIRNDITKVKADAIVNTANPRPVIGSGTDTAIYQAAGKDALLAERKKIGNIAPGEAVYTDAFDLNARYIIHTVGPGWIDGNSQERDILRCCYENSLTLADQLNCKSIAFPLIATGVYGFPKDEALQIALSVISKFLISHEMNVILVVFDREAFQLSGRILGDIAEFIDDHYQSSAQETEYGNGLSLGRSEDPGHSGILEQISVVSESEDSRDLTVNGAAILSGPVMDEKLQDSAGKSLAEFLDRNEETFQQRLFELIDESGMDDVSVYKKANISRKVFSRIRCKKDYRPKKKTAVAFAIALELDMPTMTDLLARAEIAFSPGNPFDLIITYFVTNKNYDIYEINAALFQYGQPLLGE